VSIRVITCAGHAAAPYLADLAQLRIAVFRDYPYLYVGDIGYERDYLAVYASSPRSLFVLALDGDKVIGVSSGIPLADDGEAFQRPFRERDINVDHVFYFGESVLLPEYRGQGIGHRFFDEREAYSRRLDGFHWTAFCSVERAVDDPRRPADYRSNDVFWRKRGYRRQDSMFCALDWKEAVDSEPTSHKLRFWLRPVDEQ
jgi:GNAT superfamily N-acetyltransferase